MLLFFINFVLFDILYYATFFISQNKLFESIYNIVFINRFSDFYKALLYYNDT